MKIFGWVLTLVAFFAALGAATLSAFLAEDRGNEAYNMGYRMGTFSGSLFIIVGLPLIVSIFTKGNVRVMIRGFGMLGLSFLLTLGHVARALQTKRSADALADARQMGDQMRAEARKEIQEKGDYTPDAGQVQQNIAKIQGELVGDSDTARGGRDLLKVSSEMVSKLRASSDIENSGSFTLDAIKTPDDLDSQTARLTKLRGSQADVVDFLQHFDQHCRDAMAPDNLPEAFVVGATKGARDSGHIDLATKFWQLKLKLTDDFLARQDLLKKDWGKWQSKDGKVLFADDDSIVAYNATMKVVRDDADDLKKLQTQFFQ